MSSPVQQPVVVLSRRKPHLIFILVLSVITGVSIFIGNTDSEIPLWLQRIWAGSCSISGALALIAHLQRWDRERGMFAERGALVMQCAAIIAYVLALPIYIHDVESVAVAFATAAAWVGANLWEVKLISTDLEMINAAFKMKRRLHNAADH